MDYLAPGVNFDGGDCLNCADGKKGTVSFWFKRSGSGWIVRRTNPDEDAP